MPSPHRLRLVRLLAERAYREDGAVGLSSGRSSPFYVDAKQVTYLPAGVEAVGHAVLEKIQPFGVQGVGGLTMGADAIVCSVIWAARSVGLDLPGFVVRKEPKKHGLQKLIEGVCPPEGSKVAIVEDVATTGGSGLRATRAAQEQGWVVAVVVALLDREEGAAALFEREGIPFQPLCTASEVRAAAREKTPT